MSNLETKLEASARHATLRLSHAGDQQVLTARLPAEFSREDFSRVAGGAYDLISKLTGHPCGSGRIKFVVEDYFFNEAVRVDLRTGQLAYT